MRHLLVALAVAGLAFSGAVSGAVPVSVPASEDKLTLLLADPHYAARRDEILEAIGQEEGSACRSLARYEGERDPLVREHAVRALADWGCGDLDSYRPFMRDSNGWVVSAVVDALERHLVADGVPYLLGRLSDRRHVISEAGSWTVREKAHRALRIVTCQSFHFDAEEGAEGVEAAVNAWRRWYDNYWHEPREEWVAVGLARARRYLASGRQSWRLEGLQLLALIGPPGHETLGAAFARHPDDIEALLSCRPDEPPRVTEKVPCVLTVVNMAARPVALVPGNTVIRVEKMVAERGRNRGRGQLADGSRSDLEGKRGREAAGKGDSGERPTIPRLDATEIAHRIVDLAPGESFERLFQAGPVQSAGRYEIEASVPDLAAAMGLESGPGDSAIHPWIEARTTLRFEQ